MNILYFVGALLLLLVFGYAYFLLVAANREKGITRVVGQVLSALLVLVVLLLILLYKTGIAELSFMPERPTTRIMRGMSGYVTGMMTEDERAIDEFIAALKASPGLYERFQERLK